MDFKYPTLVKLIFAILPFVNTLYRWFYFWRNELMFIVLFARWGIFYVICFFFVIFLPLCVFVLMFIFQGGMICVFFWFCHFSFLLCFCAHIHSSICQSWGLFVFTKSEPCFIRDSAPLLNVFFCGFIIHIVRAESPI